MKYKCSNMTPLVWCDGNLKASLLPSLPCESIYALEKYMRRRRFLILDVFLTGVGVGGESLPCPTQLRGAGFTEYRRVRHVVADIGIKICTPARKYLAFSTLYPTGRGITPIGLNTIGYANTVRPRPD
jgi:hypothetical protein